MYGYCNISKLQDDPVDRIGDRYKLATGNNKLPQVITRCHRYKLATGNNKLATGNNTDTS